MYGSCQWWSIYHSQKWKKWQPAYWLAIRTVILHNTLPHISIHSQWYIMHFQWKRPFENKSQGKEENILLRHFPYGFSICRNVFKSRLAWNLLFFLCFNFHESTVLNLLSSWKSDTCQLNCHLCHWVTHMHLNLKILKTWLVIYQMKEHEDVHVMNQQKLLNYVN